MLSVVHSTCLSQIINRGRCRKRGGRTHIQSCANTHTKQRVDQHHGKPPDQRITKMRGGDKNTLEQNTFHKAPSLCCTFPLHGKQCVVDEETTMHCVRLQLVLSFLFSNRRRDQPTSINRPSIARPNASYRTYSRSLLWYFISFILVLGGSLSHEKESSKRKIQHTRRELLTFPVGLYFECFSLSLLLLGLSHFGK